MHHAKEHHGILSGNTIRRTRRNVSHHGKGVVCDGDIGCWLNPPKNGGLCMNAGVKWGYSARKNNREFHEGFSGRTKQRCAYHGNRMCHDPIPDVMTTYQKRMNNKRIGVLNLDGDLYSDVDENEDSVCQECQEFDCSCSEIQEDIPEENDMKIDGIEAAYAEYEKMRKEEVDIDEAYAAYEKMKEDAWIILENEN